MKTKIIIHITNLDLLLTANGTRVLAWLLKFFFPERSKFLLVFKLPVLLLLLEPFSLHAQELPLKNYTSQDEINPLPKSPVISTYQDSLGYLWIANYGLGLVRYDGQKMEKYNGDENVFGTAVFKMLEDKYGRLWVVSSDRGLSVSALPLRAYVDGKGVLFVDSLGGTALYRNPLLFPLNTLATDAKGRVWLGTKQDGLLRYSFDGPNTVIVDTIKTAALMDSANAQVTAVAGRDDGSVWTSLEDGRLLVLKEGSLSPTIIEAEEMPCLPVASLYEDDSGVLWGGCRNSRLWKLNEKRGHWEFEQMGPTLAGQVTSILEISPGTLWVSGLGLGIWELDTTSGQSISYARDNGLLDVNIWHLAHDREGNIWISQNTGLSKLQSNQAAFRYYTSHSYRGEKPALSGVEALAVQPDVQMRTDRGDPITLLAVGTTEGLTLIGKDGSIEHVTTEQGLTNNVVLDVCLDGSGRLWATTRGGVDLLIFQNSSFPLPDWATRRTLSLFGKQATLNSYKIGHTNACNLLPPSQNVRKEEAAICFEQVALMSCMMENQWFYFNKNTGIPAANLMSAVSDTSGYLYVGSSGAGIFRSTVPIFAATLDTLGAKQIEPGLSKRITELVFQPVLDAAGKPIGTEGNISLLWVGNAVWAGVTNGNLHILEGSPPRVMARIDSTKLSAIAQVPPAGAVWIGTSEGLFKIDPVSRKIERRVTEHDGLLDNESSGPGALAIGEDGTVYQGSAAGLSVYRPKLDRPNSVVPVLAFRRFSFSENRSGNNELELNYAALSFANEKQVRYRTRLAGYDEDWSPPTDKTSIRYTNLSAFAFPKTYTFEVKAANNDGIWTKTPLKQDVQVWPAFWARWWALLLYGFLFAGVIFVVDRHLRQRLIAKEHEKNRERELQQAKEIEKAYHELERSHTQLKLAKDQLVQQEKLASLGQLTAGIAHEIKNPLNFVNNFSDLNVELIEETKDELSAVSDQLSAEDRGKVNEALEILNDIEANLRKIYEHGSRADSIVKSMLQHSRGGDGQMEPEDLNTLAKEFVNLAFHGMRAGKEPINVDIEMDLDDSVGEVPLIAEDFSRVILNLCNNAFDAMREKALSPTLLPDGEGRRGEGAYLPQLTVQTFRENGQVIVQIGDNGPGIPEEIKDKILQPFFTTKKGTEGTGLGLSITNDIVKAHGGDLKIVTKEGKGSSFSIALPLT